MDNIKKYQCQKDIINHKIMKTCKQCKWPRNHNNPLISLCRECTYKKSEANPKQTRIKQVSDKKKERLSKYSEKDLFKEIWNEREHICEECWKFLKEAKAHNFDHIIPKSKWEEYRLDKSNIKLICFACHFTKTNGLVYKWVDYDF